jgi:cell division transport system permease protein
MIWKIVKKHIFSKPLVSVFTVLGITAALSMLGTFWTVVENLERVRVTQDLSPASMAQAGVTIFVDSKISEQDNADLKKALQSDKRISKVEIVNSQDALKALEMQFGEPFRGAFTGESLPVTYRLVFGVQTLSRDEYVTLLNELRAFPGVLDVDDGMSIMPGAPSKISSRAYTWANVLLVMVFSIVALLVSHLIRVAFESLKGEVETMKILGASKLWIFRPLLVEGFIFGSLGAIFSLVVLAILVNAILPRFALIFMPKGVEIISLSFSSSMTLVVLSVLAAVVGALFTFPLVSRPPREM